MNAVMILGVPQNAGNFLTSRKTVSFREGLCCMQLLWARRTRKCGNVQLINNFLQTYGKIGGVGM